MSQQRLVQLPRPTPPALPQAPQELCRAGGVGLESHARGADTSLWSLYRNSRACKSESTWWAVGLVVAKRWQGTWERGWSLHPVTQTDRQPAPGMWPRGELPTLPPSASWQVCERLRVNAGGLHAVCAVLSPGVRRALP